MRFEPLRAWYWNLEDPREETDRRVAAIMLHYQIPKEAIVGRLFINSTNGNELVIAGVTKSGAIINRPVVAALTAEIRRLGIDVLIIDPFVSCHRVPKNDNGAIDAVAKTWAAIASATNIGVELVHHVHPAARRPSSRNMMHGARMSKDEAEAAGLPFEEERRLYFRIDRGKDNLRPPAENADWRKLVSVPLDNGTAEDPGDWIGVVVKWEMPGVFADTTTADLRRVQKRISEGEWREDVRAKAWAGHAVADVLGLDLEARGVKKAIARMLAMWIKTVCSRLSSGKTSIAKPSNSLKSESWRDERVLP